MNVKLLEKVKARILRNGKRFNMRFWGVACSKYKRELQDQLAVAPCGTQACLAGETVLAAGLARIDRKNGGLIMKSGDDLHIQQEAQQALGISYEQGQNLFMFQAWTVCSGWPPQFENAYNDAKTVKERAKVAAGRIDYFIKHRR